MPSPDSNMHNADRTNEFTDLLNGQHSSLFAYIYAIVHNLRDAEDIYQDVALTLWEKFGDFQSGTNFAAWAQATARFKVRDFLRHKRRGHVCFNDELLAELAETLATSNTSDDAEAARAYHRGLLDCMDRLAPTDQQLLALSYAGNHTLSEVAEQEGRSQQSICNSLKRIRNRLLECITRAVNEGRQ